MKTSYFRALLVLVAALTTVTVIGVLSPAGMVSFSLAALLLVYALAVWSVFTHAREV